MQKWQKTSFSFSSTIQKLTNVLRAVSRETTSCSREPLLVTNPTTTSSLSAVATAWPRSWKRRRDTPQDVSSVSHSNLDANRSQCSQGWGGGKHLTSWHWRATAKLCCSRKSSATNKLRTRNCRSPWRFWFGGSQERCRSSPEIVPDVS